MCRIVIETPVNLTTHQRELLEQFEATFTGAIDPYGRILHATGLFTEEAVQATIPVWQPRTFYSRYGDVFAYACVVICSLLCLISLLRPKEPVHGTTAINPV